jgi:hypothetical protein
LEQFKKLYLKKAFVFFACYLCSSYQIQSQNLTSSPYSRYGLGEINQQTFSPSQAMGGSFIAWHQDTLSPFFINSANPAGLAGMRLSTFELGGQAQFTTIRNQNDFIKKRNLNFSYGSVAFPIKRFGGAAFGIMPYSTVGYKITSTEEDPNAGKMTYTFQGTGGINKAFIAAGIKPFHKQLQKFYSSAKKDTLLKYQKTSKYKFIKFTKNLLSEAAFGASANYLFGNIYQSTNAVYPGSTSFFNAKRERSTFVSDFTFNTGFQTHFSIDSVRNHKKTTTPGKRRGLKQKINIGVGFFANVPGAINARQSNIIYNYAIDGFGIERPKDTLLNSQEVKGKITMPFEMGIGLSIKKGEKLTLLMDAAKTNWTNFEYFGISNSGFRNSYRYSMGINYSPNKLAYGSSNYYKRVQYRLGLTYTDGYIDLKQTPISNYALTVGLGLPVGLGRFDDISMVNISAQCGKLGTTANNLLQEDYYRIIIGFTFNKRWFVKYKYD